MKELDQAIEALLKTHGARAVILALARGLQAMGMTQLAGKLRAMLPKE